MGRESGAFRCKIDHAWMGPGIGNEFGDRLGRKRWIYQHYKRHPHDPGDRRDVAHEIEVEFLIERRVNRVRRSNQEERIAVGRGANDRLRPNIGATAGTVLNDEWL